MVHLIKPSVITFVTLCLSVISLPSRANIEPLDHIIAIVDSNVIVASEYQRFADKVRTRLKNNGQPMPSDAAFREQVLERMISSSIQHQMAERAGVRVDDATLNQAIEQMLSEQQMPLSELKKTLNEEGVSYTTFREDLRKDLIIQKFRQKAVGRRIKVTDQEIDNALTMQSAETAEQAYELKHFFIDKAKVTSQEAVENYLAQIRSGNLPKDLSQTKEWSVRVNDLGQRKKNEVPTILEPHINQLKVGEFSNVITTDTAYHIFELVELHDPNRFFVKQTKARHILLKPNAVVPESEVKLQLAALREDLLAGADFITMAKAQSEDTGTARNGGDLGWVNPGELDPNFEQAMQALQLNEISEPVKSAFGWHIVQVLERRTQDMTEEKRRNDVAQEIRKRKFFEEYQNWLVEIRDQAYVEVLAK